MKLGIIGKPQSGKTTVFNAASGHQEAVGDFSQAVHRAIIKVPDERVDGLAKLAKPKKVTYAEIEFLDAPGFTGKGKEAGTPEISPDLRLMEMKLKLMVGIMMQKLPLRDTFLIGMYMLLTLSHHGIMVVVFTATPMINHTQV